VKSIVSVCVVMIVTVSAALVSSCKEQAGLSVIMGRKSVRNYTGDAIGRPDLEKILRAGMAAPTAMNKRPWNFVVVTDRAMLHKMEAGLQGAPMLKHAGAAIVVCAVRAKAFKEITEFAVIDSTLASENILLAAEALGLGAVWTAAYPDPATMDFLRKTLNIPADIIPLNVIPIGKPAHKEQPKDKWEPANIHWEKW
jgi:nitroreductase